MKILIGYDGSEASHAAITDLRRAGLPADVTAIVLTATEVPILRPSAGVLPPLEVAYVVPVTPAEALLAAEQEAKRARSVASRGLALVSELFPTWTVQTDSPDGPAYFAIVEKAYSWPADLVVVGSHGRSALDRLFFGNVAQNVLSHCPCSVRIGRGQNPNSDKPLGFPLRVLLGADGSPGSIAAVEAAGARSWPVGSEIRLVTVADLRLAVALIDAGLTADEANTKAHGGSPVERVIRAAGDRLRSSGLGVTTVVLEGDPKHMLLREAEQWGADCIILGAQGHSRLQRFLLGSVSASVAARAGCTVEVVRPPSPPDHRRDSREPQ
jgi:nucleotide-binding universal stress UspA family protein